MSGSTLNPPAESPPGTGIGHSTAELGPSDSSDSGSDVQGAVRHPSDIDDELDAHALEEGALEFDSDTDQSGTGERASADGDGDLRLDGDILPDSVESIADIADDASLPEDALDDDAAADAAARRADRR
ncbi:chemotaxis protein [Robbsia sp. Bb-Pol-6]|uniref:Chemotaxis protein n=1 Tax=Robbsia betulipollinis TaxID=2981849 RepID=A0ABT3ZM64_9BURK|nr:chemotaxis protein [Robbsia betulipollinis]MCY0387626.1 chemotaxis protein [Robbsia betulipollinis]